MEKHARERKAAKVASNDGKCWWVHQFMLGNPNRILEQSRKFYEK